MMIAIAGFSFASCSDDDDEPDYTPEVVGEYEGDFTIEVGPMTLPFPISDTIVITRTAENQVKVTLKDFSIPTLLEPTTIVVENIVVGKEGDFFTLEGTDSIDLTAQQLGSGSASVQGGITPDKDCAMEIIVQMQGTEPMTITIYFETEDFPWE